MDGGGGVTGVVGGCEKVEANSVTSRVFASEREMENNPGWRSSLCLDCSALTSLNFLIIPANAEREQTCCLPREDGISVALVCARRPVKEMTWTPSLWGHPDLVEMVDAALRKYFTSDYYYVEWAKRSRQVCEVRQMKVRLYPQCPSVRGRSEWMTLRWREGRANVGGGQRVTGARERKTEGERAREKID